jgi:hypothetical protein
MAEIYFSLRSFVSLNTEPETGIFHTVEGKVLYAGNNTFTLHTTDKGCCHSGWSPSYL